MRPLILLALCGLSSCIDLNPDLLRSAESMKPLHEELLRRQAEDPNLPPSIREAYRQRVEAHHAYLEVLRAEGKVK